MKDRPVVPPDVELPEITVKAVVLSVVLAAVLAAANAYLGLFAGMTVSASIPAAVASMAILRMFRRSNILENNIVQTAASSGEALAAGVIFTIPALLLVGYWTRFEYWDTVAIAATGGLLGVLFTIPLRRALIVSADLRFPEGVATAEVLKVGAGAPAGSKGRESPDVATLVAGALLGAGTKLAESGLKLWSDSLEGAAAVGRTVIYAGVNLSPALIAVGFIVGLETAIVVALGGAIGWLVLLPVYGALIGMPDASSPTAAAMTIWSTRIRYIGIGAMLVGGLWTLGQLRTPVAESMRHILDGFRRQGGADAGPAPRTERDASLLWIVVLMLVSLSLMALVYRHVAGSWTVGLIMTVVMAAAAFLFSAVAAYMAGLIGSSSNPVSGVTIATLMLASLVLVVLLGRNHPAGPAAALLIGAVVCCAAAMGGDNLQDLKTGHLVGSTPWKQQIMQVVGVATAAVVIVPVLTLLQLKYGIGEVTAEHPHPLSAPQATLMANLARGVFGEGLPWPLVGFGAMIAGLIIAIDRRQAARGASFRLPVLAVALGIYLPLKLSMAVFAGGLIAGLAQRARTGHTGHRAVLFAAGLITGEALMGIGLALPIALTGFWPSLGHDPLALFHTPPLGPWPGVLMLALIAALLYRVSLRREG